MLTLMTTLTTFYELKVRELAVWTHQGKGSQCCSQIPQTVQSVPAVSNRPVSAPCVSKPQQAAGSAQRSEGQA